MSLSGEASAGGGLLKQVVVPRCEGRAVEVLAAVSACPSDTSATNGGNPKRIGLEVWEPTAGEGV